MVRVAEVGTHSPRSFANGWYLRPDVSGCVVAHGTHWLWRGGWFQGLAGLVVQKYTITEAKCGLGECWDELTNWAR